METYLQKTINSANIDYAWLVRESVCSLWLNLQMLFCVKISFPILYFYYKDSKSGLVFSIASVVAELFADLWFFIQKSFETYWGPMLPPGGRNWQLIYPNLKLDAT